MSFRLKVYICFSILSTLLISTVMAEQKDDFTSDILVAGQEQSEFLEATRLGLESIIERITNNTLALVRPEVEQAMLQADTMVEQFSYRSVTDEDQLIEMNFTTQVEEPENAQFVLQIRYSPESVEELLGQQISKQERDQANVKPSIVWMVVEENGRSHMVGEDHQPEVFNRLTSAANEANIKLVFPLLDLQDLQSVSIADIRGGFNEQIKSASVRYDVNSIISGVIKKIHSDLWVADWRALSEGNYQEYKTAANNMDEVIRSGISWVVGVNNNLPSDLQATGLLSGAYSRLWVSYINSTDRYVRVYNLLESLSGIDLVIPSYLSGEGMMFLVASRMSQQKLAQRLSNIPWLQRIPRPDDIPSKKPIPANAEIFFEYAG